MDELAQAKEIRRLIRVAKRHHFPVWLEVAGERVELPPRVVTMLATIAEATEGGKETMVATIRRLPPSRLMIEEGA